MKTALEHLNTLPMPTWRWLGVNEAALTAELPEILPLARRKAPPLPEGVRPLGTAPAELATLPTGMGKPMQDFAAQWANDTLHLEVAAGQKAAAPLVLPHTLDADTPALVSDHVVVAGEGSEITLVESWKSGDDTPALHAGCTRIVVRKNAAVRLVRTQLLNEYSVQLSDVGVYLEEGATFTLVQAEFGAAQALTGARAVLAGQKAHAGFDIAYFGDAARRLDMNYVIEHIGRETTSEMHAGGAVMGECSKIFRGTIDFKPGAARSVGHEQENTLLFGNTARNRSAPLILCGEENVEGQHAATIGKLDADLLFYLTSRGLSEEQAKRLMVDAQFAPTLAKLPNDALREEIQAYLAERMRAI